MAPSDREAIFELVTRLAREVVPHLETHAFALGDRLDELGANSMDRADIVMMAMEELALRGPRVEFGEAKTVGALVDAFYAKSQAS